MSIKSAAEFEGLKRIGNIVRLGLHDMTRAVRPGITTAELSRIGEKTLCDHGAESSPRKEYSFPAAVCISVNEEAIHGLPASRPLREGDLVKLDLTAEKDGFVADAAVSVRVGKVAPLASNLVDCAERAFRRGAKVARAGNRVYEIGRAVEREVRGAGFNVMRALCGHGVGRQIHEPPSIPNFFDKRSRTHLTEGLVITIEPIISAGTGVGVLQPDGWTVRTADNSLSAHFEHTVVVTRGDPILLTA